jgi:hypothetical protein
MRTLGALFSAFCTATVLALAIGLGYLAVTGKLGRQKLAQVVAVMHGLQPLPPEAPAETVAARPAAGVGEQRSQALMLHNHQLDERERFIAGEQDALNLERGKLVAMKAQLTTAEEAFKKRQSEWEAGERVKGIEEAVLLMSKLSPSQAKELILLRLNKNDMDWVVVLMRKLPADRQAKIAGEFTTQEETQKLDEIVRRIRDGQPPLSEPEKTR